MRSHAFFSGFDGAQHDVGNKRYGARIQLEPRGHGAPGLDLRPEDFHEIAKKVLGYTLSQAAHI